MFLDFIVCSVLHLNSLGFKQVKTKTPTRKVGLSRKELQFWQYLVLISIITAYFSTRHSLHLSIIFFLCISNGAYFSDLVFVYLLIFFFLNCCVTLLIVQMAFHIALSNTYSNLAFLPFPSSTIDFSSLSLIHLLWFFFSLFTYPSHPLAAFFFSSSASCCFPFLLLLLLPSFSSLAAFLFLLPLFCPSCCSSFLLLLLLALFSASYCSPFIFLLLLPLLPPLAAPRFFSSSCCTSFPTLPLASFLFYSSHPFPHPSRSCCPPFFLVLLPLLLTSFPTPTPLAALLFSSSSWCFSHSTSAYLQPPFFFYIFWLFYSFFLLYITFKPALTFCLSFSLSSSSSPFAFLSFLLVVKRINHQFCYWM